jgi:hypothetical protein
VDDRIKIPAGGVVPGCILSSAGFGTGGSVAVDADDSPVHSVSFVGEDGSLPIPALSFRGALLGAPAVPANPAMSFIRKQALVFYKRLQ